MTTDKPKLDPYFYVRSHGIKEKVLRGLEEDENLKGKKEINMPLGPGRYVPYSDRFAAWHRPITMGDILRSNDEKEAEKSSLIVLQSSMYNDIAERKKLLSSGERTRVMMEEVKEAHPTHRILSKVARGLPRDTIGLPTVRLGTLGEECKSSGEEEEEEREIASSIVRINEESNEFLAARSEGVQSISKLTNRFQSQLESDISGVATDEEHLDLIVEHRANMKSEVPMPIKMVLYEESFPILKSTVKAYKDILTKENPLRIEAENYLKIMEIKTKKFTKIKRQL